MEKRIMETVINEELVTIDNNEFIKITYDTGEQIYKGFDKQFNAWITLKFRQTDDREVIERIEQHAHLLL